MSSTENIVAGSFKNVNQSSLVSLKDVDFSYAPGERTILSGLNMEFPRGKVVAVMGGSGCGKTTVLRLIGGQVSAQKGQVPFEGQDVGVMSTQELMPRVS